MCQKWGFCFKMQISIPSLRSLGFEALGQSVRPAYFSEVKHSAEACGDGP